MTSCFSFFKMIRVFEKILKGVIVITGNDFIKESLSLHLFFARIMKEHSFFLEIGFTSKDYNLINQADYYRKAFDDLLADAIALSDGVVNTELLQSGEVITPYTMKAEMVSSYYTGIQIQTEITKSEAGLAGDGTINNPLLEQRVYALNDNAIRLINSLVLFKSAILSSVLSCNLFTMNYPLLIDHILREAKFYLHSIQRLQNREDINLEKEAFEQESFWNRIMGEHARFIRGLLDPTENDLIIAANNFGNEFDQLTNQVNVAMERTLPLKKVTNDNLNATKQLRDFKEKGTQGILECKVKSMIIPLLGDHVLREANHYLRLLNMFERAIT